MKIAPDSNILLRAALFDDPVQGAKAERALSEADLMAVTLPALCEFVWVLRRKYKKPNDVVAGSLRKLLASSRVVYVYRRSTPGWQSWTQAATLPTARSNLTDNGSAERRF